MRGAAWLAMAAVVAALVLPAAAQPPPGLAPVQVAIDALPRAVHTAIVEAQDRLLADTARRQLEDTHAYVQGFQQLPAAESALADPQVRAAYAWIEGAAETLLAIPARLEAAETSFATCSSYGVAAGVEAGGAAVRVGLQALADLDAVSGALEAARVGAPRGLPLDLAPFEAAVAELADWSAVRGVEVRGCLEELAEALGLLEQQGPRLAAVLVPDVTWRTGAFRVLGAWTSGAATVRAPTLGLDRQAAVAGGSFQLAAQVPRAAALGNHTVTVEAGGQSVALRLEVVLAPSTLVLHAPAAVRPGQSFHARASVSSPAGLAEVDLGTLTLSWMGSLRTLPLASGIGSTPLDAGEAERVETLAARYSGTDVVAPAEASQEVRVQAAALGSLPPPSPPAPGDRPLLSGPAGWGLLLLLALLLAVAAAAGWRLRRRRPGPAPAPAARTWPGAESYAAAVGLLFALLRRLRLVPPGRTVREWALSGHAPMELAEAFEQVRYGGRPEGGSLRERGIAWARRRWERP
jgi:hypothetical protein